MDNETADQYKRFAASLTAEQLDIIPPALCMLMLQSMGLVSENPTIEELNRVQKITDTVS